MMTKNADTQTIDLNGEVAIYFASSFSSKNFLFTNDENLETILIKEEVAS